jgi:hypothetical protein
MVGGVFGGDVTFGAGGPRETTFTEIARAMFEAVGDAYLARLDVDDGSFEWAHYVATDGADLTRGVVALPGGGVAAFGEAFWLADRSLHLDWSDETVNMYYINGQIGWMARFDAMGEPMSFDLAEATFQSGDALPDGDLIVAGKFETGSIFGEGTANELAPYSHPGGPNPSDPYVLRLDY